MKATKGSSSAIAESADLLAAVGGFCSDAPTRAALRLSCLAWRNACPAKSMRVLPHQLDDFAWHLCSSSRQRRSRLFRGGLVSLRLECFSGIESESALLAVPRHLLRWAPRLKTIALATERRPVDVSRPLYWGEVTRALRPCASEFVVELRGANAAANNVYTHVDALWVKAPTTPSLRLSYFDHLKEFHIDDCNVDVRKFRAPKLKVFDFTPRQDWYDRRTRPPPPRDMGFIPTSVKKLTLPEEWALSRGGQAMLERVAPSLEDLTVYYDNNGAIYPEYQVLRVLKRGSYKLHMYGQDSTYDTDIDVESNVSEWRILEAHQERIAWREDTCLYINAYTLPTAAAAGVVIDTLRCVKVFFRTAGREVPNTHLVLRAALRSLKRILPNLERLHLEVEDDWDGPEDGWEPLLRNVEAEEVRAAERDLLEGASVAPWPSRYLYTCSETMGSLFALCPTIRWNGGDCTSLAVQCPGLQTFIGRADHAEQAVRKGVGGITCLRLTYGECGDLGNLLKTIASVHAQVPQLQLERSNGREWWTAEEVAGLEYDVV